MKNSKESNIEDQPKEPRKFCTGILQRKFKINYNMAKEICDLAEMAHLENGWFDVKEKPAKDYGIEMLVFGKPINSTEDIFGYFIAFLNPCSGWVKKDDHSCLLYVTHYQMLNIPKEENKVSDLELVDLSVGRRIQSKEC